MKLIEIVLNFVIYNLLDSYFLDEVDLKDFLEDIA